MSELSKIEGKVAGILSERELIINLGKDSGIKTGMLFKILSEQPYEVKDPETNEVLGIVDREKVRVKVIEVQEKFSVCKTYRKWTTRGGALYFNMSSLVEPPQAIFETLKVEDATLPPPLPEEESYVKRGDRAIQIMEPESEGQ